MSATNCRSVLQKGTLSNYGELFQIKSDMGQNEVEDIL